MLRNLQTKALLVKKTTKHIFLKPKIIEVLVERLTHWEDLASGKVSPENEAGRKFIEMAKGKRKASTEFEHGYKYVKKHDISLAQLKNKLEEIKAANNSEPNNVNRISAKQNLPLSQQARRGTLKSRDSKPKISKPARRVDHSQIPGAGLAAKTKTYVKKAEEPFGNRDDYKKDKASWKRGGT